MRFGRLRVLSDPMIGVYAYYLSNPCSGGLHWGPDLEDIQISMPLTDIKDQNLTLVLLSTGVIAYIESNLYERYTEEL